MRDSMMEVFLPPKASTERVEARPKRQSTIRIISMTRS
jgi:hypothetical protein